MLKGAVVVVTGASRGIGEAIAMAVAKAGARVVIASRDVARLEAVAGRIRHLGAECHVVITDITSESSVRSLFEQVEGRYGRIDVLVNNAGILSVGLMEKTSVADWTSVIDTNLKGPFLCSKAAIPMMRRHGSGHIVNIASRAGTWGIPDLASYSASKFGLIGLSQALGRELLKDRIRVSYVCPGTVDTDLLNAFPREEIQSQAKAPPSAIAQQVLDLLQQQKPVNTNSLSQKILRKVKGRLGMTFSEVHSSF